MPANTEVLTKTYFKRELSRVLNAKLNSKIDGLARVIVNGFADVENRLGARIDRLTERVAALEKRITSLERRFDAFLDDLDAVKKKLRAKPSAVEVDRLDKRVKAIERVLNLATAKT